VAGEDFGTARIARLPDEIDIATRDAAEAELLAAFSAAGLVIADMTRTSCCDSAGMRMLLAVHEHARSSGSTLRVAVRPGSSVARVMTILGVRRILSVFDSVADAQAAAGLRQVRSRLPATARLPAWQGPPRVAWPWYRLLAWLTLPVCAADS
jgi:anti-anti-sigma factor